MRYNTIYNDPVTRSRIIYPWVYWDNFLTDDEINSIISHCESLDKTFATTFGSKSEEDTRKHRVSDVCFVNRNDDTAWIYDKLNFVIQAANEMYYNFDLNGYNTFQYTTYNSEDTGRYDWHTDMSFGGHFTDDVEMRKLSVTLNLNDDYEGGEFQINTGKESEPITCQTKKGRAIMFPSFMVHRVAPVTKGIRKSIVIWVVGPKFR